MSGPDLSLNGWIIGRAAQPAARIGLLCLPYAGGAASIYRTWQRQLPPEIEVWPVQLPGREQRIGERPYTDLEQLIPALIAGLGPLLERPFAIFGHSMGALIGFELARALRRAGRPGPLHIFASGCRAPQLDEAAPPIHQLDDAAFLDEVQKLGGTPQEVLQHRELIELLLPVLRADFTLVEAYRYTPEPPLGCSITAFGGLADSRVLREDVAQWRAQTDGSFALRMFPGDHFFIRGGERALMQYIRHDLAGHLR